ncbi:thiopeptide-type bacteriocin biosynthesis protein [Priestia megaterium]
MRYWDGGPHIRVRLHCHEEKEKEISVLFETHVKEFLIKYPSNASLDINMVHKKIEQFSVLEGVRKNNEFYKENSIVQIPYIPEYERYGGEYGIKIAEHHFWKSSEQVVVLLNKITTKTERLRVSLELILSYLKATNLPIEEVKIFLENYFSIWKRYLGGNPDVIERHFLEKYKLQREKLDYIVMNSLFNQNYNSKILDRKWGSHLSNLISSLHKGWEEDLVTINPDILELINLNDKTTFFITSYIHMTNNRLGITPHEEAYLSYIIMCVIKFHSLEKGKV